MGADVRYYTTTQACSCPDWRYRPHRRPCKHVRRLEQAKRLIETQEAFNNSTRGN